MALKEPTEDEREYLQGLIDDYYDDFVERVAEGRDMDPQVVRDTEARVYLGDEADERGLVDRLGTRDDVEASRSNAWRGRDDQEYEPERGRRASSAGAHSRSRSRWEQVSPASLTAISRGSPSVDSLGRFCIRGPPSR